MTLTQTLSLAKTSLCKGPRKRGNIVTETLLRKHCFLAAQMENHLLKKQNVSENSQKQMFPVRANKETFRETTMFPQQCFAVCGRLKSQLYKGFS